MLDRDSRLKSQDKKTCVVAASSHNTIASSALDRYGYSMKKYLQFSMISIFGSSDKEDNHRYN